MNNKGNIEATLILSQLKDIFKYIEDGVIFDIIDGETGESYSLTESSEFYVVGVYEHKGAMEGNHLVFKVIKG